MLSTAVLEHVTPCWSQVQIYLHVFPTMVIFLLPALRQTTFQKCLPTFVECKKNNGKDNVEKGGPQYFALLKY